MTKLDIKNSTVEIYGSLYKVTIHKNEDESIDCIETRIDLHDFKNIDEMVFHNKTFHPRLFISFHFEWELNDWFTSIVTYIRKEGDDFNVCFDAQLNIEIKPDEISKPVFHAWMDNAVEKVNTQSIGSIESHGDGFFQIDFITDSDTIDLKSVLSLIKSDLLEIISDIQKNGSNASLIDLKSENFKLILKQNFTLFEAIQSTCKTFQSAEISVERIVCFLLQFESLEQLKVVIRLLQNLEFLDANKINHLIKMSYAEIEEKYKRNALLLPLGTGQDSSSVVGYSFFKDLESTESESLDNIGELGTLGKELLSKEYSAIIFIDDNITSGTQLYDFFTELIIGKKKPEMVKVKLTKKQYEKLKRTPIFVCYAVQLTKKCNEKISQIIKEFDLELTICASKVDFNNYLDYSSPIMTSHDEADFSRTFIEKIAKPLYKDKKWDSEKLYNRLLGYGNLGKLTVFYYNVPKSLIPIFWKYGQYKFRNWIPLFPEREETIKMKNDNADFRQFEKTFALELINENKAI